MSVEDFDGLDKDHDVWKTASPLLSRDFLSSSGLEEVMPRKRKRRDRSHPVRVDEALFHPELVAQRILQQTDDYGDPEEALEMAARNEEGRLRHGFRALVDDFD